MKKKKTKQKSLLKQLNSRRLVYVRWIDAVSDTAWIDDNEFHDWLEDSEKRAMVEEVGWVVYEDADKIVLSSQVSTTDTSESNGNRTLIQKKWIEKIVTIKSYPQKN